MQTQNVIIRLLAVNCSWYWIRDPHSVSVRSLRLELSRSEGIGPLCPTGQIRKSQFASDAWQASLATVARIEMRRITLIVPFGCQDTLSIKRCGYRLRMNSTSETVSELSISLLTIRPHNVCDHRAATGDSQLQNVRRSRLRCITLFCCVIRHS